MVILFYFQDGDSEDFPQKHAKFKTKVFNPWILEPNPINLELEPALNFRSKDRKSQLIRRLTIGGIVSLWEHIVLWLSTKCRWLGTDLQRSLISKWIPVLSGWREKFKSLRLKKICFWSNCFPQNLEWKKATHQKVEENKEPINKFNWH